MDHRRCFRFKLEIPAWFRTSRFSEELTVATTLNVSATGICLVTREPVEVGQNILMQVRLPDYERVIINTHVVWVKERREDVDCRYFVGLRLVEPIEHEEKKFVKFCAQKMLEFFSRPPE